VLQNRVTPVGEIVASDAPYTMFGNRGILHSDRTIRRCSAHASWIVCHTELLGTPDTFMRRNDHYTELFFLDEATAFAAGHRPCGRCRPDAYRLFKELVARTGGPSEIGEIDRRLHRERIARGCRKITFRAEAAALPDGTFVRVDGQPLLFEHGTASPWTLDGYGDPVPRPAGPIEVLTPATFVQVMRAGYRPSSLVDVDG
jgi:hypothetical protein